MTRINVRAAGWYETDHSFAERNRLYLDNALALLEHAARIVFDRAGLDPREVDGIVVASTTGIATPSLDAMLVDRLGLRRDARPLGRVLRAPYGQPPSCIGRSGVDEPTGPAVITSSRLQCPATGGGKMHRQRCCAGRLPCVIRNIDVIRNALNAARSCCILRSTKLC